jgi:hypothetical protein
VPCGAAKVVEGEYSVKARILAWQQNMLQALAERQVRQLGGRLGRSARARRSSDDGGAEYCAIVPKCLR